MAWSEILGGGTRDGSGRGGRPTRSPRTIALVALAAALLAVPTLGVGERPAGALDVCNGQWQPVLRDVTINQGLGTYGMLARNKQTLARLFITAPSCAPANSEQLVSATVTATEPADPTPLVAGKVTTPTTLGPTYPTLLSYTSWPQNDSPSFPTFVLPAFGQNDLNTNQFTATFTFTVTYQYQAVAGGNWTSASVSIAQSPNGVPITASVNSMANPTRVLVVPMGDRAASMCDEFPEARLPNDTNTGSCANSVNGEYADTVVQNSMSTFSRLMPEADGVGDLNTTAGGVLYHLDDLNIGVNLGASGLNAMTYGTNHNQFCLNGSNFSGTGSGPSIASQLASFLQSWNSTNPTSMHADRVLGVVWSKISLGSDAGCADGFAVVPTTATSGNGDAAVIRLIPDQTVVTSSGTTTTAPSMSGGLAGMELSHTWGSVPLADLRDTNQDYHSSNVGADPTGTKRGYNTRLAQWLASPLSAMRYSGNSTPGVVSAWNNNTVLLEAEDYRYDECVLTPTNATQANTCSFNAVPGQATAAAAGPSIAVAGTTNGNPSGTYFETYYTTTEQSRLDPSSTYRLVEYDSSHHQLADYGLPVHAEASDHDGATVSLTRPPNYTVDSAVPTAPSIASFEVWNGEPGVGTELYSAAAGPQPQLISTSGGASVSNLQDFTNAPGDETKPAVSPNGNLIAWRNASGIVVQQRSPSTNKPVGQIATSSLLAGATDPAWNATGTSLAYVTNAGDIDSDSVLFNASTGNITFGANPTIIYNHLFQTPPAVGSTAASHPSWSPGGSQLAASVNGNVYSMTVNSSAAADPVLCDLGSSPVASPTCVPLASGGGTGLTASGDNLAPSWSSTGGTNTGGLVAYQKGTDIYVVDPASPNTGVRRIANGLAPAWGANLLAFVRPSVSGQQSGALVVANGAGAIAPDGTYVQVTQVTSGCSDATPSLAGDASGLVFDRVSSTGCATTTNGHDVMVGSLTTDASTLSFSYTAANAANLKADLFDNCAPFEDPIFVAVPPTTVSADGKTASWTVTYPPSRGCPGSQVQVRVTDGYNVTPLSTLETLPGRSAGGPAAVPGVAIANPSSGSTYLQYDAVMVSGSTVATTSGTNSGVTTQFYLSGPAGSGFAGYPSSPVGAANQVTLDLEPATPNGWIPGSYTLTLRAANTATGETGTISVTYSVLSDPSHSGSNVGVDFNPQTLYVPSSGNDVTLTVTPNGQDLSQVSASSVYITQIGDFEASIPVDTSSGNGGWTAGGGGTYSAKFSRQTITCFMNSHQLSGGYVPVVLTATAPSFSITGFDKVYPTVTPASSPVTC